MTTRMLLPFTMGKTTHIDPTTYEPVVEHPILDIGSSYSAIKPHIMEWLREHYGDRVSAGFDREQGEYYIDFPTESDVMLFLLRWR